MSSGASFEYYNPTKILCGCYALDNLPYELSRLGVDLPFVLIDAWISSAVIKKIVSAFKGSGMSLALFEEVPPEPDEKQLLEMAALFSKNSCNALIVVGEDSVVNTARLLALTLIDPDMDPARFDGRNQIQAKLTPLIQIPCELYGGHGGLPLVQSKKWSATSSFLLPNLAVLDTGLVKAVEPLQGMVSLLPALTISLESVAGRMGNPVVESLAMSTATYIMDYLTGLLTERVDEYEDAFLAHAQITAGIVMAGSDLLVLPMLADALCQTCNKDKGVLSGILMPYMLEIFARNYPEAVGNLLPACGRSDLFALAAQELKARCTINIFHNIMQRLSEISAGLITATLEDAGVPWKSLDRIAQSIKLGYATTKKWDSETVLKLLTHAWRGIPIAISAKECFGCKKN